MTGDPPSEAGAVHDTVTCRLPATPTTPVGAPGTVDGAPTSATTELYPAEICVSTAPERTPSSVTATGLEASSVNSDPLPSTNPKSLAPQQYAEPAESSAQAKLRPASIDVSRLPASTPSVATGTGTGLLVPFPSPNWPRAPYPQQSPAPNGVTAQVLDSPEEICAKSSVVNTATGSALLVPRPSPRLPKLAPSPQQYARPSSPTAQTCWLPTLTEVNLTSSGRSVVSTRTGTSDPNGSTWSRKMPSPNWPSLPRPQQYATPSVARPHVVMLPTLI